jgi:restriction system protein
VAIPDFQSLMLPFLRVLADGSEKKAGDVITALARELNVTDDELREQLPSGRAPKFAKRVHWARMFLKAAGLFENPARGVFRMTERGKKELRSPPSRIDIRYLHKYPEFAEWRRRSSQTAEVDAAPESTGPVLTPQEQMDQTHRHLSAALADELLERVRACDPSFFEALVVQLLLKMGYGGSRAEAGSVVGRSGDGGIDGVIAEDRLGLDAIYVQAKKWDGTIGASQIRDFLGGRW